MSQRAEEVRKSQKIAKLMPSRNHFTHNAQAPVITESYNIQSLVQRIPSLSSVRQFRPVSLGSVVMQDLAGFPKICSPKGGFTS